ncbi:MAG: hypothetical protein IPN34_16770 [Planctomycetes bacterium]|nr:hypothetical protein [Planctomycetota bacterium]
MPCIIRRIAGDRYADAIELASGVWTLREQVEALDSWLRSNRGRIDASSKWVADIGFCVRKDAGGGGPVISKDLMTMCLEVNLEIYLSEYPGEA